MPLEQRLRAGAPVQDRGVRAAVPGGSRLREGAALWAGARRVRRVPRHSSSGLSTLPLAHSSMMRTRHGAIVARRRFVPMSDEPSPYHGPVEGAEVGTAAYSRHDLSADHYAWNRRTGSLPDAMRCLEKKGLSSDSRSPGIGKRDLRPKNLHHKP